MAVVIPLRHPGLHHPAPAPVQIPVQTPTPKLIASQESVLPVSEKEIDQQLVERVQKGDRRAFDLLVGKYQHKIMSVISRYIRNPDEVQDVAQDTFVRARQ